MKNLLLITVLVLSSLSSFAIEEEDEFGEKTTTQVLAPAQFLSQLKKEFNDMPFEGSLEDQGFDCIVASGIGRYGHDEILMNVKIGGEVLKHDLVLFKDDKVKTVTVTSGDDYSVDYTWGGGSQNRLLIVHASDAFDYVMLSNSSMKMTCGNWY